MEIPYAGDRNRCFFCHATYRPGRQCACGVWYPPESYPKIVRKKTAPAYYEPLHNGCLDSDPLASQHDELYEYRDELQQLDVPVEDDAGADAIPEIEIDLSPLG